MVAWGRLLATHVAAITLGVILCEGLGKYVSNLVFCVNREDLDKSLTYVFAKVVVANVYVCMVLGRSLGSLASSRAPELSSKTLQYT